MTLTTVTPDDSWTYFGLWSASKLSQVSQLLASLNAKTEIYPEDLDEERLKSWSAWDETSPDPHRAFHLFIYTGDLEKVGDQIVTMFPERK